MYLSFNSEVMTPSQITDYLTRVVQPRLQTVDGVANAQILGGQTFAMRIWLDPTRMASLGVTPNDVRAALAANNFTTAAGEVKGDYTQISVNALTSLDSAKAFYRAVFGWGAESQGGPEGGPPAYTEWKLGGKSVGGMMLKMPEMPAEMPNFWGVYFAVADTDATVSQAQKLGGTLIMAPMDIEPGRFATMADPVGAMFNVLALKPETSS